MKILLVNDDGIHADGLHILAKELEKDNEVIIVAPDDQRSACGHSITLGHPLVVKKIEIIGIRSKAYSVSGTPADCVRIGVLKLFHSEGTDIIISGINRGVNLGRDILYSGTVSAAIEGAINGIPSIAVSAHLDGEKINYEIAAKYARKVLKLAKENYMGSNMVLNLNVPSIDNSKIKGIKVCKSGGRLYEDRYKESGRNGDEVMYIANGIKNEIYDEGTDVQFLNNGYVTLTPLHYDLTDYNTIEKLKEIID
ncbi:5'/3'-nucleotidase SurE [Clostridium akagii]|uniref:5'/3'-nucleotidase SurE n=1 Tax=Clostridium akagii TaxID=91623 RepID=UPI000478823D|nr:5'/3'-nucleotidase SurE [Clostridium akagii]